MSFHLVKRIYVGYKSDLAARNYQFLTKYDVVKTYRRLEV